MQPFRDKIGTHDEPIRAHERTVLQPDDYATFFRYLESPPAPTEALRAAFERYLRTVVSKG